MSTNNYLLTNPPNVYIYDPGDLGSIPGRVIPKTQKMVLDASLLNTQIYKVRIKGKVEQSREGVAPSPTPWCSSYRKGSFGLPSTMVANFTLLIYIYICMCVCGYVCISKLIVYACVHVHVYIYIYIYTCVCVCVCVCV